MTRTPPPATAKSANGSRIDYEKAQRGVRLLLEAVGEDPTRDGLEETWQRRVPEAFATLTEGNSEAAKPTMRTFDAATTGLVTKTGIPMYSLCDGPLSCPPDTATTVCGPVIPQ